MKPFLSYFAVFLFASAVAGWYRVNADLLFSGDDYPWVVMASWLVAHNWLRLSNFLGFWVLLRYAYALSTDRGSARTLLIVVTSTGLVAWLATGIYLAVRSTGADIVNEIISSRIVSMIMDSATGLFFLLPLGLLLLAKTHIWKPRWSTSIRMLTFGLSCFFAAYVLLFNKEPGDIEFMPLVYFGLLVLLVSIYGSVLSGSATLWGKITTSFAAVVSIIFLHFHLTDLIYRGFAFSTVFMIWTILVYWPPRMLSVNSK